jgi:hypothetical protein
VADATIFDFSLVSYIDVGMSTKGGHTSFLLGVRIVDVSSQMTESLLLEELSSCDCLGLNSVV